MKKNLFALFALFALTALTGCTQNELPEGPASANEDLVEIRLKSAANPLAANTRSPFIGEIGAANKLTAKVLLTKTTGGFVTGCVITPGAMIFSTDNKTNTELWNTKNFYPTDDSPVYLCGLHPDDAGEGVTKWGNGTDESAMTYVFDGKTDVMAAAEIATKKSEAKSGTYKELAFKHLLTNLIIKAEPDLTDGATAEKTQEAWGNITSIELIKVNGTSAPNNKVTVTLKTAAAATTSAFGIEGAYGVGFYKLTGKNFPKAGVTEDLFVFTNEVFAATAIPKTSAAVAYSMIAPIVATKTNDFILRVKTVENTTGIEVPINLLKAENTQGQYCIVTLKFKNTTILATASVEDWKEGGTAGEVIQ